MAKKNKKKKKAEEPDLLKPINIFELGGDKDPCFGKGYDLTTDECKRCGDSELCAIAMAQKLNVDRKVIESETEFKDISEDNPELTKFIRARIKKDYKLSKIKRLAVKKLGADPEEVKSIYKSLNKK